MESYVTSLASHVGLYGSLFMNDRISFSLQQENSKIENSIFQADPYFDSSYNDFFISVPMRQDKHFKRYHGLMNDSYQDQKNFFILFPDGTGQILYPSGNIGVLITCSNHTQFTFIILEDVKQKPQIQAVFMSNGNAACYHLNGMLWFALDPFGGSYFNENGIRQKYWTWWDLNQHVHAPPLQSITVKINSNIDVKVLSQDKIYLTFGSKQKKITLNVGSKLTCKDPKKADILKLNIGKKDFHLLSKRFRINNLLNNISNSVRLTKDLKDRAETVQGCIVQMQETFLNIRKLARKEHLPTSFCKKI
ncbi:glutamate-rich protein 6B [Bombina bombina]|uniref:glutamate-rich protein 6B n=1 Tax=Bombina bombina TaxID=8345 RepID=UPI00235B07D5|nr:glutamate-rich protein 6B [Bombina bombina]